MNKLAIDTALAENLIAAQFPKWRDLPVRPVVNSGWDNRTFHLGEEMLIRLPSASEYALQVEKEHKWLPQLAPSLPLRIPTPLAMGNPGHGYPWKWSVYYWLEGNSVAVSQIPDMCVFAKNLAEFLNALQAIDASEGPIPGLHSFFRGAPLSTYDAEVRHALNALKGKIDVVAAENVWEKGLLASWVGPPVWVHGDISAGNLLVQKGQLCAVIDFGQLTVGDPSCDLAISWTLFKGESRELFRSLIARDEGAWARGRAWALWKSLTCCAGFTNPNNFESAHCWRILDEVLG